MQSGMDRICPLAKNSARMLCGTMGLIAVLAAVLLGGVPIALSQKAQRGVKDGNAQPSSSVALGPYYALVIGNNDYRYLPKLQRRF